jgi:hypothetical protein
MSRGCESRDARSIICTNNESLEMAVTTERITSLEAIAQIRDRSTADRHFEPVFDAYNDCFVIKVSDEKGEVFTSGILLHEQWSDQRRLALLLSILLSAPIEPHANP